MTRCVPASLLVVAVFALAANADDPAPPSKADAKSEPPAEKIDVKSSLTEMVARQVRMQANFKDFKSDLRRLWKRMAASSKPEDQERARLLEEALEKANDTEIDSSFERLVAMLKAAKPDDEGAIGKAITETEDLEKRLRTILKRLPRVPILFIDGSEERPGGPHKDGYYLEKLFVIADDRYHVVNKTQEDLDTLDLSVERFPSVYLLDVPTLSEKAAKRLETYVEEGGQVAIFVGEHVKPKFYNERLYAKGRGIFPVPLEEKQPERISDEERFKRLFEGRNDVAGPRMQEVVKFLIIDQYWPTEPRSKWVIDPTKVQELVTLPNRSPVDTYKDTVNAILGQLDQAAKDEKFDKFQVALERYKGTIQRGVDGGLYPLGEALHQFLRERGDPKTPTKAPDLKPFWDKNEELRAKVAALRDMARYGDPLVLSKSFGKGRTVVFLTTAGKAWNDWAGGGMASFTYPVVMLSLQKYLISARDNKLTDDLLGIVYEEGWQNGMLRRIRQQLTGQDFKEDPDPKP